jgi:iron complex outermembrane recepter protein
VGISIRRVIPVWALAIAVCAVSAEVRAQEEEEEEEEEEVDVEGEVEVEVVGQRPKEGATEEVVGRERIESFPHRDAEDLLRLSPGMHLSAHGGRGKAYQIFVRGFDAVHGSDVAVSLEGIPLNEATHIHGQGYVDLHFIPPEAVLELDLAKGAVRADRGDFAIAASADYRIGLAEPGLRTGIGGGTDRSVRGMAAFRPEGKGEDSFLVGDVEWSEGVGQQRGHRAVRVMGGLGGDWGDAHLRWFGGAYSGWFESPGVLRQDDLDSGEVDFHDAYSDLGGGTSRRLITGASLEAAGMLDRLEVSAHAGLRQLSLLRNFTGYSFHPVTGDGRRQDQEAMTLGGTARYTRALLWARDVTTLEIGLSIRGDQVAQADYGVDALGEIWSTLADADIRVVNPGAWVRADVGLFERVRLVPAVRFDALDYRVVSRVDDLGLAVAEPTPAHASAWTLSPKAAAEVTAAQGWRWYLSYGRGFRSPQARGLHDGDVAPLTRADTVELGTHFGRLRWLDVRAAVFYTFVANELVFDHVSAQFLASGSTRRIGGELITEVTPLRWLRVEADLTYADGRYLATAEPIPYAPRLLVALGLYAAHSTRVARGPAAGAPLGLSAGLRAWVMGPRPLPEDLIADATFNVDVVAEMELGWLFVQLQVDNLLGRQWRDGEFVFPSCFDPASGCSSLPVRHVTAGTPRALRVLVGVQL